MYAPSLIQDKNNMIDLKQKKVWDTVRLANWHDDKLNVVYTNYIIKKISPKSFNKVSLALVSEPGKKRKTILAFI